MSRAFVKEPDGDDSVGELPDLPVSPHAKVISDSPLGKIPTLVLEDGTALYDSRVICEYLAGLAPDKGLLPASGEARWRCLTLQALGQGLADAAVNLRYETALRPEDKRWSDWIESSPSAAMYGSVPAKGAVATLLGTVWSGRKSGLVSTSPITSIMWIGVGEGPPPSSGATMPAA